MLIAHLPAGYILGQTGRAKGHWPIPAALCFATIIFFRKRAQ